MNVRTSCMTSSACIFLFLLNNLKLPNPRRLNTKTRRKKYISSMAWKRIRTGYQPYWKIMYINVLQTIFYKYWNKNHKINTSLIVIISALLTKYDCPCYNKSFTKFRHNSKKSFVLFLCLKWIKISLVVCQVPSPFTSHFFLRIYIRKRGDNGLFITLVPKVLW